MYKYERRIISQHKIFRIIKTCALMLETLCLYTQENFFSNSLEIEKNMMVVTVFLLTMNQTEVHLIHNQKDNCHYDRILFSLK